MKIERGVGGLKNTLKFKHVRPIGAFTPKNSKFGNFENLRVILI